MHDIWNPWHGCRKVSEGCEHCYMFYLDAQRQQDGSNIYRTRNFDYPLQRDKRGAYKVRSGEYIRVCLTSDFFLEEADAWRDEAWSIISERPDVVFFLLTKRPQRVAEHLPRDWGSGWENVFFNVTAENQRRADERIPILLDLPFCHKGVMVAPFIGEVSIAKYLASGQIEQVISGGENYDGARPCHFEWVQKLRAECAAYGVNFNWFETGTVLVKDGKTYRLPSKTLQSRMAWKSGVSFIARPLSFKLRDALGLEIPEEDLYKPQYCHRNCQQCGGRGFCNGCVQCGLCERGAFKLN